jgi:hypothetical protein
MNFSSQSEGLLSYWSNIPNCALNFVVYVTNYGIRRTENGVTKIKGKLPIITRGRKIIKGQKKRIWKGHLSEQTGTKGSNTSLFNF